MQHEATVYPQCLTHEFIPINYTSQSKRQYVMQEEKTPLLLPKQTTYIQSVVGTFLYYALGTDLTMLPELNHISMQQSQLAQATMTAWKSLMDYTNT